MTANVGRDRREGSYVVYRLADGALSPLDGIGPGHLRIAELERRVRGGKVREVIFATNPNAEGEATAGFIAERIRG